MSGDLSIGVERRRSEAAAQLASSSGKLGGAVAALKRAIADGSIFLPLVAIAFWALTHPFQGIVGDARFYMGRALADLDPAGVGRDIVFVHDGQSRFSVFAPLLDRLVAFFGTGPTALALALASIALWIAALAALARQYVAPRYVFLVVLFVALLPVSYGTLWRFEYSEVLAVPRPFAEALVLIALAALANGRTIAAFACVAAASLIHPIMALAGWGVLGIVLCREDRRWTIAVIVAVVLLLAGTLCGLPILHGLASAMDPGLKAFAQSRSPLLFPTRWPIDFLGPVAVEATTLTIAASFFQGRRRTLLLAAIFVGAGGIAAQALFGDMLSLLLVIQAQPWRMAWLLAALGSAALGISTIELWRQGPRGRVVLAVLAMAWLGCEESASGALICIVALTLHFGARWVRIDFTPRLVAWVWGVTCILALVWNVHYFIGYGRFLAAIPADGPHYISQFWTRRYIAFPILALVGALVFARPSRAILGVQCAVALIAIFAAARFWDERISFQKMSDANLHPPALMNLIAGRGGEVLWVDGLAEAWFLTGRPQWASPQQGVSTIFSGALAREWGERMRFLIRERLAAKNALLTGQFPSSAELPRLTVAGLAHLCVRPDAPAYVIAPVEEGEPIPPQLKPQYWHLHSPNFRMTEEPDSYGWKRISAYAVLPCAKT